MSKLLPVETLRARVEALNTEWEQLSQALKYAFVKQLDLHEKLAQRLKEVTDLIWEYRELLEGDEDGTT